MRSPSRRSKAKVRSSEIGFRLAVGENGARILAPGQRHEVSRGSLAQCLHQPVFAGFDEIPDGAQPEAVQPRRRFRPDAPEPLDRQRPQPLRDVFEREDDQTIRLLEVRSDFRQKLGRGHADRGREPLVRPDPVLQAPRRLGAAAQIGHHARQVQKRLVDRQRLDQGSEILEDSPDLPRHLDVEPHPPRQPGRLRAEPHGDDRRHRRAHAVGPRLVRAGRHHAARPLVPDDQRFPRKQRVFAHLDGGVERVHVDMQDDARPRGHRSGRKRFRSCGRRGSG